MKPDKSLTEDSDRFLEYLLDRPDVQKAWRAHTEHEFVSGLADGTLPVEAFKNYLIQDYLFLVCRIASACLLAMVLIRPFQIQFARANALAAYKAKTMENIAAVSTKYQ